MRPAQSRSRLALLALLACACAVGPDYSPPDLDARTGAAWREPQGEEVQAARQELAGWWRELESPELSALVERLLSQNLSLAVARQRVVAARAARGIAESERRPQLGGEAGVMATGTGDESLNFQGPLPGREVEVYYAGVTAAWELDLWGRVARLVELADAEIDVAVEDYRAAAVSLLAELALAYVDAHTSHERLAAAARAIDLRRETLRLAESRLAAGSGTRFDVEQATRELAGTQASVPALEHALAAAENRIAVLIGERPTDGLVSARVAPALPAAIGIGLPADLLSRRPDVRARERALAAAVARSGVAEAERYPRVALLGTLALRAPDADALLSGADALSWSIGPTLSVPLFTGGRLDSIAALRDAQADAARLEYEGALLAAIEDVENAAVGVVRTRERLERLQAALDAARAASRSARELYDAGSRPLYETLDAERAQVAAEDAVLLARGAALAETIGLYRALGGGFESLALDGRLPDESATQEPAR